MGEIPLWALAASMLIILVATVVAASVGFGFNILAVPFMSLLHPDLAPNPQLIVGIFLTGAVVWRERSHLQVRPVVPILLGRPVGTVIGALLLGVIVGAWLDLVIGVLVLAAVVVLAGDVRVSRRPSTMAAAGVLSGFSSIVAAIGGPPLMMLYRDQPGAEARTQLGLIFAVGGALSIVLRVAAGALDLSDLWVGLTLLPAAVAGFFLSARLHPWIDRIGLRLPVLSLSAFAAVALLVRSAL